MKGNKKIAAITEELAAAIIGGRFGASGERFLTVRDLADRRQISLEYASKVMTALAEKKIITLLGKQYFLTYRTVGRDSPFYEKYRPEPTFGMIVSDLGNGFVAGLARETAIAVAATGYAMRIVPAGPDVAAVLTDLQKEKVSGIFVDPYIARTAADDLAKYPLPVVSLGCDLTESGINSITVDNYHAGILIADHFCAVGCNDFAYIGLLSNIKNDERLRGFREGIEKNGFTLDGQKTLLIPRTNSGKYESEKIFAAVKTLMWKSSSFKKIGIFCYHDLLAYEVITALGGLDLERLNRSIPKNIAIAGFDDLAIASIMKPTLTTISYPTREMAEKAVDILLSVVKDGPAAVCNREVAFTLVRRDTTAT